jgi:uncharacterized Zn finger protein
MAWYAWRPYVPVSVRRRNAARDVARFKKKRGEAVAPVVIQGRIIARSFWGKAWCDNLESYSDFANRLPRGRTYVRNGSVMDLQLGAGTVRALVSGSELYRISVRIAPLARPRWQAVVRECAGKIGSLVELLQGKFSRAVMELLIRRELGLFPSAKEIAFKCSCPDWAAMCKHVAATLYGVGARLDTEPELFFRLRRVDQLDLLTAASSGAALAAQAAGTRKRIAPTALADVFGIELDPRAAAVEAPAEVKPGPRRGRRQPAAPARAGRIVLPEPAGALVVSTGRVALPEPAVALVSTGRVALPEPAVAPSAAGPAALPEPAVALVSTGRVALPEPAVAPSPAGPAVLPESAAQTVTGQAALPQPAAARAAAKRAAPSEAAAPGATRRRQPPPRARAGRSPRSR